MPFKDDQVYCVLDYETFSEADLKASGGCEYASHESTDILCVAWRTGTRETLRRSHTQLWIPSIDEVLGGGTPAGLIDALLNPAVILVAHNALFEQAITRYVLGGKKYFYKERWETIRTLPPSRWLCTASLAAAMALPRSLEGAAAALSLPVQKDMEGRRLMLKYCKPRTPTKNNPARRHTDEVGLYRIGEYCQRDISTEVELFLTAAPLSDQERDVWILDQEINWRGFAVDRPFVDAALKMIEKEKAHANAETVRLSGGTITSATQRAQILSFVKDCGLELDNLQRGTVDRALKDDDTQGLARAMLELRQTVSKTSTAKYAAFKARSAATGRARDILMYHGASTGRWAGVGVQPQNFPRGTLASDTDAAAETVTEGDLETVRMLYGSPMAVLSSCVRSAIIAPPGHVLDVADYAQIEVRVLFWLAGDKDGVKAFKSGRDLYKELAADIYNKPVAAITKDERFLGKTAVLGCGYSLGAAKFKLSCENQGVSVSDQLAEKSITAYRNRHRPVTLFWKAIEKAAVAAVESPKKIVPVLSGTHRPLVSFQLRKKFLWCKLPSGRELCYPFPTLKNETTPWGQIQPKLYSYGVNGLTKQWENQSTYGGKLTENVVQAIARDLMAAAMLRIDAAQHWKITLSVHDELIAEREAESMYTNKDFCRLMETVPDWAKGCPVSAEGWSGRRYRK